MFVLVFSLTINTAVCTYWTNWKKISHTSGMYILLLRNSKQLFLVTSRLTGLISILLWYGLEPGGIYYNGYFIHRCFMPKLLCTGIIPPSNLREACLEYCTSRTPCLSIAYCHHTRVPSIHQYPHSRVQVPYLRVVYVAKITKLRAKAGYAAVLRVKLCPSYWVCLQYLLLKPKLVYTVYTRTINSTALLTRSAVTIF